jgi:hypothetical protein
MQQAYGFNQITLPAGQTFDDAGSGQTIAIVDVLDDPYITSDLQTFDETFNIGGAAHDPTSTGFFSVVNEDGGSTLPPTDNSGYGVETSLDVEWAHAMAPGANVLLVEANAYTPHDLFTAIAFAARQPGVSVISMSFGGGEWPTEYYLDNVFTTPAGHQGVSFIASAGDFGGFATQVPAMSPNVVSVGGTTLPADASGNPDRSLESGWSFGSDAFNPFSAGGGGISSDGFANVEAEPAYQLGVQSTGWRNGPDLAYASDPNTGVPVYDTLVANAMFPDKPWLMIGGTSAAAPQISSLVAITNQLRVAAGESTLDGPNQLLPAIYQIAATDPNAFQDITTGNNGYPAGPGYDLVTGVGTPNAQYLVPDLVATDSTPPAPVTLYWTGDASTNWDTPGNWSTVDPLVSNVQQSILPTANDHVVVDLSGATILHDTTNYDTISSFTVTAASVSVDLGYGTLDLSGGGGRGTFQVDQPGDVVTMEAAVLRRADVTSGTTLSASSASFFFILGPYTQYSELNDVQLDGTLNANQSGSNNGIFFQNGMILNGTIKLGGANDLSSVLLAGYGDIFLLSVGSSGGQDESPETMSGTGTIQLGQSSGGDGIYNWGTTGTFTIGPGITILGGGPGSTAYLEQTILSFYQPLTNNPPPLLTGGIENQGTIKENGGSLQIDAFSPALDGDQASSAAGWTNEGTIEATSAKLSLLGGWINYGTITADSASTVWLGNPTYGQLPSSPNAAYYAWSSQGSLTIGDGATVIAGGFLTTDQYQGTASIPGVSADFAKDSLSLVGTLDNTAADNAVSGGVLALTSATGPLPVIGGTVYGGSITTSGSDDVQVVAITTLPQGPVDFDSNHFLTGGAVAGGWLYNLVNDGIVIVTGNVLTATNVTNSGAINGTSTTSLDFFGTWDNTHGAISVDSSSSLYLGPLAATDPNFPPTLADAAGYAWKNTVGTIDIANGATIGFGGLMTADQFSAFPSQPGVSVTLSQDTVFLDGWVDGSPADNPVTGGVLAFTSATGPVNLVGGYIYGATITSSGTGLLNVPFSFAYWQGPLDFYTNAPSLFIGSVGVLDSVTNDGTITVNLPGFSTYWSLVLEGTVINNGTINLATGNMVFLPAGSLTNNGTLNLAGYFILGSSVTNNGSITGFFGISLLYFPTYPQNVPLTLINTGTISGSGFLGGSLTNSGTIQDTGIFGFYGNWDNTHGTIIVDPSPYSNYLQLGFETSNLPNFLHPTFAQGSPYALNLSQVGIIDVANGATFELGGLVTTDQFDEFPSLPGVSINLSQDKVYLTGWLDNSPADNPITNGVLAITASTGPLNLSGGYIYQGKIATSGSNDLEANSYGFLDGVELDGNLNVTSDGSTGQVYILNSLTLNGTIQMPGFFGELVFGYLDNAPETISGTGTIFLGVAGSYEGLLFDLSNAGLTIASGITIDAGATYSYLIADGSTIENLGTVEDLTAGSTLYTYGLSPTVNPLSSDIYTPTNNGLANYSAGTLTGGTWKVGNGAIWQVYGFDVTTNAANLSVGGTGTQILDTITPFGAPNLIGNNSFAGLTTNTANGSFTVGAGYNLTAPGTFNNAGTVDVQSGAGFSTGSNDYSQSAGRTTVDGALTSTNVWINGGSLNGTGTIAGNVTNAGVVIPGDAPGTLTIQGNYTQTAAGALDINLAGPGGNSQLAVSGTATLAGSMNVTLANGFTPTAGAWFTILTFAARSGSFSSETGMTLGGGSFFVPSYRPSDVTLVLGPGVTVVAGTDLYLIGGLTSNDRVEIDAAGTSKTGSTGVQVKARLDGVSTKTTFSQPFSTIYVYGFAGDDTVTLADTLAINANISAGDGNDHVTAGNGNNTITLGNGNDHVAAGDGSNTVALGDGNDHVELGNGNNTVTLGNGNDHTSVSDGNNVVVEGNGNDKITAGNGDNLIVDGLGQHTVTVGNGRNILIDGSVQLTQSVDSLRQVLDDWVQYGDLAANVASIRSRLAVTYNSDHANTLDAGSGLDWFWYTYAKDKANHKPTDLLN